MILIQEDKDKALKTLKVKLASYQFLTNEGLGVTESGIPGDLSNQSISRNLGGQQRSGSMLSYSRATPPFPVCWSDSMRLFKNSIRTFQGD